MSERKKEESIAPRTVEPEEFEQHDTIVDAPVAPTADVAAQAELLWGKEGDDDSQVDESLLDGLFASFDRAIAKRRAGPQKIAPHSDGGSNVAYAATSKPARGFWQRTSTAKVKIAEPLPEQAPASAEKASSADREAPTVVIARAGATTRVDLLIATMALVVGVVALGVAAWMWAGGTSVREKTSRPPALSAMPVRSEAPIPGLAASSAPAKAVIVAGSGSSVGVEAAAMPSTPGPYRGEHANTAGRVPPSANAGRRAVGRNESSNTRMSVAEPPHEMRVAVPEAASSRTTVAIPSSDVQSGIYNQEP